MKKMFWVCLLVFGFILNWSIVFAADVYVESSGSCGGKTPCYSTIQAAINAANSGDTIKVAQGIYGETFVLNSGKQLMTQGGWDAEFKNQTPRTTSIRAPIVTKGAIAFQELRIIEIAGPVGNATIADVLTGKTFSSDAGTGLTGIMPNRGGPSYTPTTTDQAIVAGYYNGSGKVEGDADLVAANIKCGKTIFGVTGTLPPGCVAKTGQIDCYNSSGFAILCPGTGQDGEYQKGCSPAVSPAGGHNFGNYDRTSLPCSSAGFTDNGNGTVTDNLTGLIWLKNANCYGLATHSQALTFCNTLFDLYCGLSDGSRQGDWRLPNINELRSLFDHGLAGYLPAGHPFTGVMYSIYWSSTTLATEHREAWAVLLNIGYVGGGGKEVNSVYVWPVRSDN
jgi:hypothetical protein